MIRVSVLVSVFIFILFSNRTININNNYKQNQTNESMYIDIKHFVDHYRDEEILQYIVMKKST